MFLGHGEGASVHEELRLLCIDVQTFYPWASLTTRLWKGSEHLELEWTIGPIPFKDGLGREISVQPSCGFSYHSQPPDFSLCPTPNGEHDSRTGLHAIEVAPCSSPEAIPQ